MTINSLSLIASTPVGGLGTQTYNVVTAGFYTIEFKSFLPFLASGDKAQTTAPSGQSVNVTAAADSAGSKNSTWWKFYSAGDLSGYYVWYNINSAGVDPAPTGLTGIAVAGATGATAATLATASITAINASGASSYVTASAGTSGHLIVTNLSPGTSTSAANGTASYGASFSETAGSYGVPPISGLDVVIKNNSTVLARFGSPSPTQQLMSGKVAVNAAVDDAITVIFSSLSTADAGLNAVKSIVNVYRGV